MDHCRMYMVCHNCWNSCWLTMLQICILSILAFWKRSCIWERNILISCEFNLDSFLWMGNGSWKYCLRVYVCITIVGIPFGKQFFKMARLSFMPFGANVL